MMNRKVDNQDSPFVTHGAAGTRLPLLGDGEQKKTTPPTATSGPTRPEHSDVPAASSVIELPSGTLIKGRYSVQRHLAGGGMGDVLEVFDEVTQQSRAIKVMKSHLLGSQAARERFLAEATVRNLRHPHLVTTIDVDEWDEQQMLFIVMELAPGKSLRQWLREQTKGDTERFSVSDRLEICRQVASALSYAHQWTVHRDIKPENIIVERTTDGQWHARLADFGILKLIEASAEHNQTIAGQSFGTPQYMSPEQSRDSAAVDHRTDVFSLGVVLYELLTDSLPQGHFSMPSEIHGSIPSEVDAIIKRSLANRQDARYADMAMMHSDLERILASLTGKPTVRRNNAANIDLHNVDLGQIVVQLQDRRIAQVEVPGLPRVPDKILLLRGQIEELRQAITDLDNEIHPALRPQQETLRQLEDQVEQAKSDLKALPLSNDKQLCAAMNREMLSDGSVNLPALRSVTEAKRVSVSQLVLLASALSNVRLAEETLESVRGQFKKTVADERARLTQTARSCEEELDSLSYTDLCGLLESLRVPADGAVQCPFPIRQWGPLSLRLEQQRRFDWTDWKCLEKAKAIWEALNTRSIILQGKHSTFGLEIGQLESFVHHCRQVTNSVTPELLLNFESAVLQRLGEMIPIGKIKLTRRQLQGIYLTWLICGALIFACGASIIASGTQVGVISVGLNRLFMVVLLVLYVAGFPVIHYTASSFVRQQYWAKESVQLREKHGLYLPKTERD